MPINALIALAANQDRREVARIFDAQNSVCNKFGE